MTQLDKLTYLMRDATPEEYESVNEYIRSISVDTGVNFYQIDDEKTVSEVNNPWQKWSKTIGFSGTDDF